MCRKAAAPSDYANLIRDISPPFIVPETKDMEVIENQNSTEIETTDVLEGSNWKMLRKVIKNDVSNLTKAIGEEDNICHISIR